MTYLELINEWETDIKSQDHNFYVNIYKGDNWDNVTVEDRAMALVEILTGKCTEMSTENF